MDATDRKSDQLYKIKLASGRIVGPIAIDRVRLLILKKHVTGDETARLYPNGEWTAIGKIQPIAELLLRQLQGSLSEEDTSGGHSSEDAVQTYQDTVVLPGTEEDNVGVALEEFDSGPPDPPEGTQVLPTATVKLPEGSVDTEALPPEEPASTAEPPFSDFSEDDEGEATVIASTDQADAFGDFGGDPDEEATKIGGMTQVEEAPPELAAPSSPPPPPGEPDPPVPAEPEPHPEAGSLSGESTVIFERSDVEDADGAPPPRGGKFRFDKQTVVRFVLIGAIIGLAIDQFYRPPEQATQERQVSAPIRPTLPAYTKGESNPDLSKKLYAKAMQSYILDDVVGYKKAAALLHQAVSYDISNVQALAMLASSYLNLIDSSNKDENYFAVISKLIEMSRAKNVDLPETVIADVEFYVTVNQGEAAQNRIVEYTRTHRNFPIEMFYYLAYAFYSRGDFQAAARYLSQYPDNKASSPKIFFLRGQIAEKLGSPVEAIREYQKAVGLSARHARSRLRIADIMNNEGRLSDAKTHLDFLVGNPQLLSPRYLARTYYLHGRLREIEQDWEGALADINRAVELDPENQDYLLEYFSLRAKNSGDKNPNAKKLAKMFYFLSEGEKMRKQGRYHDALTHYQQARQANLQSALPLMKIGDMFVQLNDTRNAMESYEKAVELAPKSAKLWSRYIRILIESYEWEKASQAMGRFRALPEAASLADKLSGDLLAKQGRPLDALGYYRKAMGRESIDPSVYIAYGKALVQLEKYKEAPFFFSLALRFDPLNMEAIVNTAKCVAQTQSIDDAIVMLQDHLQKAGGSRAELLAAIAELEMHRGEWESAQNYVNQARQANPDYAYPWKLQARIHLNDEGIDKDALDKALRAFKSYSDRNPSDPSGYMERYKIFLKQAKFEKAADDLNRIYEIYPKYPSLHFYKGVLYSKMGNHKVAIKEFRIELDNNPNSVQAMLELGKELITVRQVDKAAELFNKAMAMAPRQPEPKHQAGWANYLLKNYQGAIALLSAASRIDEGNPTIFKRLGLAYRAVGDRRSAAQAFRRYLELAPDAPDRAQIQKFI